MKKIFKCACLLLLSLSFWAGCGSSNSQNNSHTTQQSIKSASNNYPSKTHDTHAKTYNGWITVKVEEEVEFQIPPTMELQSEEWKTIEQNVFQFYNTVTDKGKLQRIVAHQKGLNAREERAKKQYARAIIKIGRESEEIYPNWGENISFSAEDLKCIEDGIVGIDNEGAPNGKLVGISQHLKVTKVNGIPCLHGKYETQLGDRPIVNNEVYMFWNKDRMYMLHTLIRSTEYDYWTSKGADMRNIVNTFKPCK